MAVHHSYQPFALSLPQVETLLTRGTGDTTLVARVPTVSENFLHIVRGGILGGIGEAFWTRPTFCNSSLSVLSCLLDFSRALLCALPLLSTESSSCCKRVTSSSKRPISVRNAVGGDIQHWLPILATGPATICWVFCYKHRGCHPYLVFSVEDHCSHLASSSALPPTLLLKLVNQGFISILSSLWNICNDVAQCAAGLGKGGGRKLIKSQHHNLASLPTASAACTAQGTRS